MSPRRVISIEIWDSPADSYILDTGGERRIYYLMDTMLLAVLALLRNDKKRKGGLAIPGWDLT